MIHSTFWNPIEGEPYRNVQAMEETKLLPVQLRYVLDSSLFYQKKFAAQLDFSGALSKDFLVSLPFTEKAELLEDQTSTPAFGSNVCAPAYALRRVHKTSGTTGRPLLLTFTAKDIATTHEAGARCFWAAGLRPGHTVIHCLNFCMWAGGLTDDLSLETAGAQVIPFGVGNSKQLIETIQLVKPDAIHCTPSYLAKLEVLLKDEFGLSPRALGLKLGLFGAEGGLDDHNFRRNIEDTWGFRAINANYGMSDVLSMFGSECSEQCGLHFTGQGIVYVELINPVTMYNLPVQQGAKGELVLTNLGKEAQPVVRYRTRDLIEILSTDRCGCGRSGFRFRILGRSDDMIIVKGINVFPGTISRIINERLDSLTGEFAIEISKSSPVTRMRIRVEIRADASPEAASRFLMTAFANHLSFQPELEIIPAGTLPRTEGKSRRIHSIL